MRTSFTVLGSGAPREVTIEPSSNGLLRVDFGEGSLLVDARRVNDREVHLLVGDRSHNLLFCGAPPKLEVFLDGNRIPAEILDERQAARRAHASPTAGHGADGVFVLRAPMPGKVVKCLVRSGEEVSQGQGIVVVEAMKMENELRSPRKGVVKAIKVTEGQNVELGVDLVLIE
jgi:biotin carboxyl carrier protein